MKNLKNIPHLSCLMSVSDCGEAAFGGVVFNMKKEDFVLGKLELLEKLPVIKILNSKPSYSGGYRYYYNGRYRCFCGKEFITSLANVACGDTKSCGCFEKYSKNNNTTTHGETKSKLYQLYAGIKARCYNKGHIHYADYGGRGIKVCENWLEYESFRNWAITNNYKQGLTIDRIDNDGNYEPSNCRWVPRIIQGINKRPNKLNTSGATGVIKRGSKWAAQISIKGKQCRLGSFETIEEASIVYQKAKKERDEMYYKEIEQLKNK